MTSILSLPSLKFDRLRLWPTRFTLAHVLLPGLLLVIGTAALMFGGGDMWLAQQAYALQGGSWVLRNHLVTEVLVHRGGRLLATLAWLFLLGWLLVSWFTDSSRHRRRTLIYLLLSVLCSVVLVTLLKRVLVVDCAWSVVGLGGDRMHLTLLDPRPASYMADHCFPAAHASVGYAWLALYFAGFGCRRSRLLGLAIGLAAGLLFGISQQLRGAHFASHDLWAAMICWAVAMSWRPLLGGATIGRDNEILAERKQRQAVAVAAKQSQRPRTASKGA